MDLSPALPADPSVLGGAAGGPVVVAAAKPRTSSGLGRLVLRRVGLFAVTLFLLSVLIFAMAELLPGNVARTILGNTADQKSVDVLNHQLGADRPAVTRYTSWVGGTLTGDFGESYAFRKPVGPLLADALGNSLKLAAVAFVMVVPLGIGGGVLAGLYRGRWVDKVITNVGISLTVVPEFVSGVILIQILGLTLDVFPISAATPEGAGPIEEIRHLILPAIPIVFVLFGYIAKMARAGTVAALSSDYARTARLKGLSESQVVRRHVLRNALLPSITVIATQLGYLIGGLVVVEILFNYQGVGLLIFQAAKQKDFPLLESGVLAIGFVYMAATLIADVATALLNPRVRLAASA
ncbi:ABC transporter permease [soil metagenome]